MASTVFPAASAGKTQFRTMLTSGTSYTVPTGVTYLNVMLVGGGGGGGYSAGNGSEIWYGQDGRPGESIDSTLSATAGNSIAYAIGGGGTAGTSAARGGNGGTTTFTGATSAGGGTGGVSLRSVSQTGTAGSISRVSNGGSVGGNATGDANGGAGGGGFIVVEYWA